MKKRASCVQQKYVDARVGADFYAKRVHCQRKDARVGADFFAKRVHCQEKDARVGAVFLAKHVHYQSQQSTDKRKSTREPLKIGRMRAF